MKNNVRTVPFLLFSIFILAVLVPSVALGFLALRGRIADILPATLSEARILTVLDDMGEPLVEGKLSHAASAELLARVCARR